MRVLIIGSGGREHALACALSRSPQDPELFIAPGNAGTAALGTNVDIAGTDLDTLSQFVHERDVDLTVVGPEQPLVTGLVDHFLHEGHAIVGPTAAAAQLEGSKAFAKSFMAERGIPTAAHRTFEASQVDAAHDYLDEHGAPIVVKASGLAAGKGAIVCETLEAAHDALHRIVESRDFGAAGERVVIEEFMEGEEASVFALTDGAHYVLLPPAQDHKPIGEGDTGPNTGGMGAYAPAPVVTGRVLQRVCTDIIEPTLAGMIDEGHPYTGVLYCGLMITDEGPKVVEFNCRLGDPEAQVVLSMMAVDWVEVFQAMARGTLRDLQLQTRHNAAACVVMASRGYPGRYRKGYPITGIDAAEELDGVTVFQAGTRRDGEQLVTNGGRVLGVTATGDLLQDALDRAYAGVERIQFKGAQYRRDIGKKGLARIPS
ncbi:MAG: phosphoribosylamine--glycine ligase [Bacteroidetes bacterium]|jgi:phosphoribosylamine--glycine ligase|nr:phosphoribosylamine--glycine ligase [Bacteroidota bacterium]